MSYDDYKLASPPDFEDEDSEPTMQRCDCCFDMVEEELTEITLPYKGSLLTYRYCSDCINHLKNQL